MVVGVGEVGLGSVTERGTDDGGVPGRVGTLARKRKIGPKSDFGAVATGVWTMAKQASSTKEHYVAKSASLVVNGSHNNCVALLERLSR